MKSTVIFFLRDQINHLKYIRLGDVAGHRIHISGGHIAGFGICSYFFNFRNETVHQISADENKPFFCTVVGCFTAGGKSPVHPAKQGLLILGGELQGIPFLLQIFYHFHPAVRLIACILYKGNRAVIRNCFQKIQKLVGFRDLVNIHISQLDEGSL